MTTAFLRSRTGSWSRALRDAAVITGTIASLWLLVIYWDAMVKLLANDGLVYWGVDPAAPYAGATVGGEGAYLYSPAFTQAFTPFRMLPREAFAIAWSAVILAAAVWMARVWPLMLLPLFLPVLQDVMIGNIHLLLALAIYLGFRWPATWAFVLLTKVTPGVGLLWFVVRREWRSLAIALGTTAGIVAVSYLIAPGQWADWLALLRKDGGQESSRLLLRLVAAAVLVTWGALTDRAWTVPIAAMLALPVIWMDSFAMLVAAVALKVRPPASVARRKAAAIPTPAEAPATPAA